MQKTKFIPKHTCEVEKVEKSETIRRTVGSILWNRFLDHISENPIKVLATEVFGFLLAVAVPFTIQYFQGTLSVFWDVMSYKQFMFVQSALVYTVWNYRKSIIAQFKQAHGVRQTSPVATIEGIPTTEILDHLFDNQTFKREEVQKKFGISRSEYDRLVSILKGAKILVHGPCNAHLFNTEYSREQVANMVNAGAKNGKISEMDAGVQLSANSYGFDPDAKRIQKKVSASIGKEREVPIEWEDDEREIPIQKFTVKAIA